MIRDSNAVLILGSSSSTIRPLSFTTGPSHSENDSIRSSTGGNYAIQTLGDMVYSTDATGLYYRSYNAASKNFNGSVLFSGVDSKGNDTDGVTYVYTADVNGDGFDDVVGISRLNTGTAGEIKVYLGSNSPGTVDANGISIAPFAAALTSLVPSGTGLDSFTTLSLDDIAIADMNKDGKLDIVIAGEIMTSTTTGGENGGTTFYSTVYYSIGMGDGTGNFSFPALSGTGPSFYGSGISAAVDSRVDAGDFNGDGLMDLVFGYHPSKDFEIGSAPAFVWFGTSSSGTSFSSSFSNGWQSPEDVQAVRPSATATADQLIIAFDTSTHFARFNSDKTLQQDNKAGSTPTGPFGMAGDYNGDGFADVMYADGNSSKIGIGYDWSGTSGNIDQRGGMHLGTDIQNATGVDFDGDGQLDFFGTQGSTFHTYFNTSGIASQTTAINLAEGRRVPDAAVNGVASSLVTADGTSSYAATILASITGHRNAIGTYEIAPDGTIGAARFLSTSLPDGEGEVIGAPAAGTRFGFFLVTDGERLNGDLSGSFHFMRPGGAAARISDTAPVLVRDGTGAAVNGTIFHTADIDPYDSRNLLNPGGHVQALSRTSANNLTIAFDDMPLSAGDADFNDLVLLVTRTDNWNLIGG